MMTRKKKKGRILVVDDEPGMRGLLSKNLSLRGFEINEAADGMEGYKAITKKRPDLVILDVIMPKMGGFTLLKRVKKDPKYSDIPVIMLTARSGAEDLNKGISLLADFYLPKPFKFDNLLAFIGMALADGDIPVPNEGIQ